MTLLEFVCEQLMGPPVSQSSDSSTWQCPRHEDNHPSFHTLPHKPEFKDRFKCWSCDFWGDVFDLLREFFPDENFSQHQLRLAVMRRDFERDTKPKVIRTRPNISFSLRGTVSNASTNQNVDDG